MAANTNICLAYKQFLLSYKSLMKLIFLITVRMMIGDCRQVNVPHLLLDANVQQTSKSKNKHWIASQDTILSSRKS